MLTCAVDKFKFSGKYWPLIKKSLKIGEKLINIGLNKLSVPTNITNFDYSP